MHTIAAGMPALRIELRTFSLRSRRTTTVLNRRASRATQVKVEYYYTLHSAKNKQIVPSSQAHRVDVLTHRRWVRGHSEPLEYAQHFALGAAGQHLQWADL